MAAKIPEEDSADEPTESGNAVLAEDPDETGYDEDHWERSISETHHPNSSSEEAETAVPVAELNDARGPMPELDELVKKIPQSSRERIDSLFRGDFKSVKVIDRKKLF